MKFPKPFLAGISGLALAFSAVSFAQQAPPPPPPAPMDQPAPPAEPMTPAAPMEPSSMPQRADSATMPTPSGELTVTSSMPPPPPAAPAPTFEQLSGGGKSISEAQAAAYPLLANDFIYADHNRNNQISKSEYKNWLSQK